MLCKTRTNASRQNTKGTSRALYATAAKTIITTGGMGIALILAFPGPGESISMFCKALLSCFPRQKGSKSPEKYPKQK